MKLLSLLASIGLGHLAAADVSIGLNFCDNWAAPHVGDGTADGFAGWTDSRAEGDTTNPAVQTTPLALGTSGVSATWTASNTWSAGSESTNEQGLYRIYLDDGQTSTGVGVQVTISGLAGWLTRTATTGYRIRCYSNNDSANTFQPISVRNGATGAAQVIQTIVPTAHGNGGFPTTGSVSTGESRGFGDSPAALTADTITLTIPPRSGAIRGTLCGFKITASGTPAVSPVASTLAATDVTDSSATLNGTVNPSGQSTTVSFQYGPTTAYGLTASVGGAALTGTTPVEKSVVLTGLTSGTMYHFRMVADSPGGTVYGEDLTFVTVTRMPQTFAFSSSATVPVTVSGLKISGQTAAFTLNFVPTAGTSLMAVKNTGADEIMGRFDNLAQWQVVNLTYNNITYPFAANYFGGTGNDLVLQWASTRLVSWGSGADGQLGYGGKANATTLRSVDRTGALAGKTVVSVAVGGSHGLALCADGDIAAWGANARGQLGDGTNQPSAVPVLVNRSEMLAGKRVVAIAAGGTHSLVLCEDGTLAAWGGNDSGSWGSMPKLVDMTGVLAGRKVTAISAAGSNNLVLCKDGTLAQWGQLGGGSTPVQVPTNGVLAGKTITVIEAGPGHCLVACADGTVAAWGSNSGELGNNSMTYSTVPVLTNRTGVLAGKIITHLGAGNILSVSLSTTGSLSSWGRGSNGENGDGTTGQRFVPGAVTQTGVLAGKTVRTLSTGLSHSLVLCSDGSMAAWGLNSSGQLGNNSTTNGTSPVTVTATGLTAGERVMLAEAGGYSNLAMVAMPPPPLATTLAATGLTDSGVTLNGSVNGNGRSTTVSFEYGPTAAYGTTVTAAPAAVSGSTATAVTAALNGLVSGTTYHFRVVVTSTAGVTAGEDGTFTTSTAANLAGLTVSEGTLMPRFSPTRTSYAVTVPNATTSLTLNSMAADAAATVQINGQAVAVGTASGSVSLNVGNNPVTVAVTAADGNNTLTYTVIVTRLPDVFVFTSATNGGVTAADFDATGLSAAFALDFAPVAGTGLTVVNNPGVNPLVGRFANFTQGQVVRLTYGGVSYAFAVDYYGGTGNDLVLQWADNRVVAWGDNTTGQLGNGTLANSGIAKPADPSGVLAGKAIRRVVGGTGHSVAVLVDGTLAAWGDNRSGQLGDGSHTSTTTPVAVDMEGVLAGKVVIQVACGATHTLAVCTDGTVAAWGGGGGGKLGYGGTNSTAVPVLVDRSGVLAGRRVIAVSAGSEHSIALCADGTLAKWGNNLDKPSYGYGATYSYVPISVNQTGVLAGKSVVAIDAGTAFNLALCADGTLAAWGQQGTYGSLGNDGDPYGNTLAPVLVDRLGVLFGKTPKAMSAGSIHGLTLCTDGAVAGWGDNSTGQLGTGGTYSAAVPVLTNQAGVLAGKTVVEVLAGTDFSLARCADGTLATWGVGSAGQLGNDTVTTSTSPVLAKLTWLGAGERITAVGIGGSHVLAVVATPPTPAVTTLAATDISDSTAILQGSVNANGANVSVTFEYGLTTAYGTTLAATPASASGKTDTAVSATLGGLLSGTTYHYRVVVTNAGVAVRGADQTFTTSSMAVLASLTTSGGALMPGFDRTLTSYQVTVPFATASLTLTPVAADAGAAVTVVGLPVASGSASSSIPLNIGSNLLATAVTAADGSSTTTYTVTVVRLPETFAFNAATDVPVTAGGLAASGKTATLALGYAPLPGTNLTVVNNTGSAAIQGTFDNLAQGQVVKLAFGGLTYPFVANYFGGTGNDLVLQWANTRVLGWGYNFYGQIGNGGSGSSATSLLPVPMAVSGVLAGKTPSALAVGADHSLVLCADGSVAACGANSTGLLLGNGASGGSIVPVLVDRSGVLAGKMVVSLAAGNNHSLALCADGTLATWGRADGGQLGNNSTSSAYTPVLVDRTGVLADRKAVAIAAREGHNLAVCDDGAVVAWGANNSGQLGTGNTLNSPVPVLVDRTGVLAGKRVTAIASGWAHALALCADGTLAAWGRNGEGQLGNGATTDSSVPVRVNQTGVLAGKTVVSIACGYYHNLVICSDGTLAAWGGNSGKLGNNSSTNSSVPVLVDRTGVLAGKSVIQVSGGGSHSLVVCADGTLASWGANGSGELGNNSNTASLVPVLASTTPLVAGERAVAVAAGYSHNLTLVGMPPGPAAATTLAATAVTDTSATLNGTAIGNGNAAALTFEYGLTTAYGFTAASAPAAVAGTSVATASLIGLIPGTIYHYRLVAKNNFGGIAGDDLTFTTSTVANLSGLAVSAGRLVPGFTGVNLTYDVTVPFATDAIRVTPQAAQSGATVAVAGIAVAGGTSSAELPLALGATVIPVVVHSGDGANVRTYQVTVTRLPEVFAISSAGMPPVTAGGFAPVGDLGLTLGYPPAAGTSFTVLNNTGSDFIQGTFANLAHGRTIYLNHGGIDYPFVANYFGGTGNDLVLQWARAKGFAWGLNDKGQLGNGGTATSMAPMPVEMTGVLAGKTIIAGGTGEAHSVVLCADGTLASWGYNLNGELGIGTTTTTRVPVQVKQSGALAGKQVVNVAVGRFHTMVLCADGTLAGWGGSGLVGDGTNLTRYEPVVVNLTGELAGKRVTAIAAGASHTLALCADGTLLAWGGNSAGQLGNGGTNTSQVPVRVDQGGLLLGRRVIAIATSYESSYALCSDGTVAAWGSDTDGVLGDNGTANQLVPVAVDTTGVLASKRVVALAAGYRHCLVLCGDGTLAAWGNNGGGQLGNNSTSASKVPVLVNRSGVLAGKVVRSVRAISSRSFALCEDGSLAAWGNNWSGVLGNNSSTDSKIPVLASTTSLAASERIQECLPGSSANHNLAIVTTSVQPRAMTLAATGINDTSATLNGSVTPNGQSSTVSFEYGLTESYGLTATSTPATADGVEPTPVAAAIAGLRALSTYHYRLVVASSAGIVAGEDMTFTTSGLATLTGLEVGGASLAPAFDPLVTSYGSVVPHVTTSVRLTPTAGSVGAVVKVNGVAVVSGAASAPVELAEGDNNVRVEVIAEGGAATTTYQVTVTRLPAVFAFDSASSVGAAVREISVTGLTAELALNYAPLAGTNLLVVRNTGMGPMTGRFVNLAQGQRVRLTYQNISYEFVANYYGGTGNDLVLHWANTDVLAWGSNGNGQLGDDSVVNRTVATPAEASGPLAGKTVIAVTTGNSHSLALCLDGSMAAWGSNSNGALGDLSFTSSRIPVAVAQSEALADKTIVAIAAGGSHNLALAADGSLVSWGSNTYGQMGTGGSYSATSGARAVDQSGVLAGKTVAAIAAGGEFSMALCTDGALAMWGANASGQLGNNSTTSAEFPVWVDRTGVLADKTITVIAAGAGHALVLCADGTLATWGYNSTGQLGNGTTANASIPVLVNRTGVLAGKTVVAIAAGGYHSLALCADGTLAAWGKNSNGQLGNNSTTQSAVPVEVSRTGVLAGTSVTDIVAGLEFSMAKCGDGTVVTWGLNSAGQLGNNSTTPSSVPVLLATSMLGTGEFISSVACGANAGHSLAIMGAPPLPLATILAASAINDRSATLNTSASANTGTAAISFEYGVTDAYGSVAAAVPASVSGTEATAASATLTGLLPGTTYHYRAIATKGERSVRSADLTFTTTDQSTLAGLTLSEGTLAPAFSPLEFNYTATVADATDAVIITPTPARPGAIVKINGVPLASGASSGPLPLAVGVNRHAIEVTSADGTQSLTYAVSVTRLPQVFAFTSATEVAPEADGLQPQGLSATFELKYMPQVGTALTVISNLGSGPIQGAFANLAQGQTILLDFNGVRYPFVANYFGGDGNDLVLHWGNTRVLAWGDNTYGKLGNNTTTASKVPVPVDATGVLAGKAVMAVADGVLHNLALCVDGSVAGWGYNTAGQLGDTSWIDRPVPVLVDRTGVLADKTVKVVVGGLSHSLALCTDGTMVTWGWNFNGQLGDGTWVNNPKPVAVSRSGVLAGKTVVAIAAGNNHSLALCADGDLVAWGDNGYGQLGNGSTTNSPVPVLVNRAGVLAGKTIVALSAGIDFSLALCTDGTLAAWGYNTYGQLGNGTSVSSSVPVLVSLTGVLAGKAVVAVAAGDSHTLALCADGTLAAWGYNNSGQLGNNSTTSSNVPVLVDRTGVLAGKTPVAIAARNSSLVSCADGTLAAWGYNASGQLGDNSTTNSPVPVRVNTDSIQPGQRILMARVGLALVASPPPPSGNTAAATGIGDGGATLNGTVDANGSITIVSFEYGPTTAYGRTVAATPAAVTDPAATAVSANVSGLASGAVYHFRLVATSSGGTVRGEDMTFTTSSQCTLASLATDPGTLVPAFDSTKFNYGVTVPFATDRIILTPLLVDASATLMIDGAAAISGAAAPIELAVGHTSVTLRVALADGSLARDYTVAVTRLPEVFAFGSATTVPLVTPGLVAAGNSATFSLNFAPLTGAELMVVRNTGRDPIHGAFTNLADGQVVLLNRSGMNYPFRADYHGGDGNDLVLRWANTRLLAWGANSEGQWCDGGITSSGMPTPITIKGVQAGKALTRIATGEAYTMLLATDGTLAAGGRNDYGAKGTGSQTGTLPLKVESSGVLAGKTVVSLATGPNHSLALCADGTLAAWGANSGGMLGDGTTTNRTVPVLVDQSGVLAGKRVVAIAAGGNHSLALCADGTLAAWGTNNGGMIEDSVSNNLIPAWVKMDGVLAGKTVTAIAAGTAHCLVLCQDGALIAWGNNTNGELGIGNVTRVRVPVAVNRDGVLAGRRVRSITVGSAVSYALCEDGLIAAWGNGENGELGIGESPDSAVPVSVFRGGVLAGKSVTAITRSKNRTFALCADGTVVIWPSTTPSGSYYPPEVFAVDALASGERPVEIITSFGASHAFIVVAKPPAPAVETLAASAVADTSATLNGSVSAQSTAATVSFEYGLTAAYGASLAATPAELTGVAASSVRAGLNGLRAGTTYHFRVVATNTGGTTVGADQVFTTGSDSALAGLTLSAGSLDPTFEASRTSYLATVPGQVASITVTPLAASAAAAVKVNGSAVSSGSASEPIALAIGENGITTTVTAPNGIDSISYTVRVVRLPEGFDFSAPGDMPLSASGFSATGHRAEVSLKFPPTPGTELTLVSLSGSDWIHGTFDNLAHGQVVHLSYQNTRYPFVVNYHGGDGNDLVLQWANTRLLAFGSGSSGQLGSGASVTTARVPTAVDASGVLRGRAILAVANGARHSVALGADGALAAWGSSESGQLGDGGTTYRYEPVWVNQSGVLAGKRVVAVGAGTLHSLALCADGTLATWGYNNYGTLGNQTSVSSSVPVLVDATGVLASLRVTAIAAGGYHNLALCADGSLVAWGRNSTGQLGNNSLANSTVPVRVDQSGALAGKRITAIAAGGSHSLVLCSDGTLAAWGANDKNQLGDNGSFASMVPVLVRKGSLAGKVVTAIAAGDSHSVVRCADGTLAAWGSNASGQLGNNSGVNGRIPGGVLATGALAGKAITRIAAGEAHSLAVGADGTLVAWGSNAYGQLGNDTTTPSLVPVNTAPGELAADEWLISAWAGQYHSLLLAASPPPPVVTTVAATAVGDHQAALNGTVAANGPEATVGFEYGFTDSYGSKIAAIPGTVSGATDTAVSATLSGLLAGVTYHYRALASSASGLTMGEDRTFTTTTLGALAGLALSQGTLVPDFQTWQGSYLATVPASLESVRVIPSTADPAASVTVNGMAVEPGKSSAPVALAIGSNDIAISVTAADGVNALTYRVRVTRLPQTLAFNSPTEAALTADEFAASGNLPVFSLGFPPTPGTRLTVLNLTGLQPLLGTFDNLTQGQVVGIDYEGSTYNFVVNYFGGTGNDLELQWLNSRVMAWGSNGGGQLGDNTTTTATSPVPVDMGGVLAGKSVVALGMGTSLSSGYGHSMALCVDGTLAAWGNSYNGALGVGSGTSYSRVPVLTDRSGVLATRNATQLAVGADFVVARCDDGTLAGWGYNQAGQLGDDTNTNRNLPVEVSRKGALREQTVVDVASGTSHVVALCADGTLLAWGDNSYGQLGTGGTVASREPLPVKGLPLGGKPVAVAAGNYHSLALFADGSVFAWGSNSSGQLGNGTTVNSAVPVRVDGTGVLAGRSVVAIAAGSSHSLAACADGTVVAWGANSSGNLGNKSTTPSSVPVEVLRSGVLSGKRVTAVSAILNTSFALCEDGTLAAWGGGGMLGNGGGGNSSVPVRVNGGKLRPGETFMKVGSGSYAYHTLALTALPLQTAAPLAATSITGLSATLNGSVNARENAVTVSFEFGPDESYGTTLAATPAAATGKKDTAVAAAIAGLKPGATYHYRVIAAGYGGIIRSEDQTFTTLSDNALLAALDHDGGVIAPGFEKQRLDYLSSVPFDTAAVTVSAMTDHPQATLTVNGAAANVPVNLAVGNNPINVTVTAEDGITMKTYSIVITRLPQEFVFNSATDIPLTSDGFAAGGNPAKVVLGFAPAPGTVLTMVNNSGLGFIYGRFGNLTHGQRIGLTHAGKTYDFIANYHGGSGNDLVLQWANAELLAWGGNGFGQLGDATIERRLVPTPVSVSGALAGKTVLALAGGYLHSLALCADGTLAAWGYNAHGQLGTNGTANSSIPVAVDQSGALAGKLVVAIAAGPFHNLALCEDGTIISWGYNNHGQLGDGTKVTRRAPVVVPPVGALASMQVVAVAAGAYQSFALGADGTVAAWGYNDEGELGNGSTLGSATPVAVDRSDALADKRVAALAAGQYHTLALTTDGTLVSWGYNKTGQLGNNSTAAAASPVAIGGQGVLAGRTPIGIGAGGYYSLAWCADGTLSTWGANNHGQLGVAGIAQRIVPVAVDIADLTVGSGIAAMAAGGNHGLLCLTDGKLAAWGENTHGQLGDGSMLSRALPTEVTALTGRIMAVASGAAAAHSLALQAMPMAQLGVQGATAAGLTGGDLVAYAFQLDPARPGDAQLPEGRLVDGEYVIRFTQPISVNDITYGAEWSATMQPGSWQAVPDTGSGSEHRFAIPVTGTSQGFIRLKVSEGTH
jgi:alpha-tubulin suppressor-like RCC1 family protein/phosphodiesterase/alkaline phosphatase D-like protein